MSDREILDVLTDEAPSDKRGQATALPAIHDPRRPLAAAPRCHHAVLAANWPLRQTESGPPDGTTSYRYNTTPIKAAPCKRRVPGSTLRPAWGVPLWVFAAHIRCAGCCVRRGQFVQMHCQSLRQVDAVGVAGMGLGPENEVVLVARRLEPAVAANHSHGGIRREARGSGRAVQ
jgi:hypothetical protein